MIEESIAQVEKRKLDHIKYSLNEKNQANGLSGFNSIELVHEAIPDINFDLIQISTTLLDKHCKTPFYICPMTAGHSEALKINLLLSKYAYLNGWILAVGSQRRELYDLKSSLEWTKIKSEFPELKIISNLGITQLIDLDIQKVKNLLDSVGAFALMIHTNPLQEVLQMEGTPQFKNAFNSLENLCDKLDCPVILKETGCGFSEKTLKRLKNVKLKALDISGLGGTHWGRIEGDRSEKDIIKYNSSQTFSNWGHSTLETLLNTKLLNLPFEIWASGGIRSGLDAAKAIAINASAVGIGQPILKNLNLGEIELDIFMKQIEFELKMSLFCTGSSNLKDFTNSECWELK